MPERPDLEYVVPILARECVGRRIAGVRVLDPVVLRVAIEGDLPSLLAGRRVRAVERRLHAVRLILEGTPALEVLISPMLAGRFRLEERAAKDPRDLAVALSLDDGRELRYLDDVRMGKVYVIPEGDFSLAPGLDVVGVDVLDRKAFTRKRFLEIARTRRDQVKLFLLDKGALDAMGNAYADEVLFEARIHPKTFVRALSDEDIERLRGAIVRVLSSARGEVLRRAPPLDEKVRDFLLVRLRGGEPCPRCGTKLRKAGVRGHDAFFCPTCQPETRRSAIVDWRSLPGPGAAPPQLRKAP